MFFSIDLHYVDVHLQSISVHRYSILFFLFIKPMLCELTLDAKMTRKSAQVVHMVPL